MDKESLQKAAAFSAVGYLAGGDLVGLGSGSTAGHAISEIARRVAAAQLDLSCVASSYHSRKMAAEAGLELMELSEVDRLDASIDGADEIDPQGRLIKGGGGAHVIEKVLAAASQRVIIVADETKLVPVLGRGRPVPVEVVAPAMAFAMRRLRALGAEPRLRTGGGKLGPVISDLGNPIIDAEFGPIADPERLDAEINAIPGTVGHGLFIGLTDLVIVAYEHDPAPRVETLQFSRKAAP